MRVSSTTETEPSSSSSSASSSAAPSSEGGAEEVRQRKKAKKRHVPPVQSKDQRRTARKRVKSGKEPEQAEKTGKRAFHIDNIKRKIKELLVKLGASALEESYCALATTLWAGGQSI